VARIELVGLSKAFGSVVAVKEVTMTVQPGELRAVIGPNGAGKTTFFNMLTGLYRPTFGTIAFDSTDITRSRPERLGVAMSTDRQPSMASFTLRSSSSRVSP